MYSVIPLEQGAEHKIDQGPGVANRGKPTRRDDPVQLSRCLQPVGIRLAVACQPVTKRGSGSPGTPPNQRNEVSS